MRRIFLPLISLCILLSLGALSLATAESLVIKRHDRQKLLESAVIYFPSDSLENSAEEFKKNEHVFCEYLPPKKSGITPSGLTNKFYCRLKNGKILKVKYHGWMEGAGIDLREPLTNQGWYFRENREVFTEVAATHLMRLLGFAADRVYPVVVSCKNCPCDPWAHVLKEKQSEVKGTRAQQRIRERLSNVVSCDRSIITYYPASAEFRYPGKTIESEGVEGWSWEELDRIGNSPAARDALRLLLAIIQFADTKADNNRLVCIEEKEGSCLKGVAMVHDPGVSFGGGFVRNPGFVPGDALETKSVFSKMEINRWEKSPVWKDSVRCLPHLHGSMRKKNSPISEAGRKLLLDRFATLSQKDLKIVFANVQLEHLRESSKDPEYATDPDQWVRVLKKKVKEVEEVSCSYTSGH